MKDLKMEVLNDGGKAVLNSEERKLFGQLEIFRDKQGKVSKTHFLGAK
jgi:hypothetical protein